MIRIRGGRWLFGCAFLVGASVLWLLWFNLFRYPGSGLAGIDRNDHGIALTRVGKAYADSDALRFDRLLESDYSATASGEVFAWGTASLQTPEGQPVHVWVSVYWTETLGWNRLECYLLADPRDRILFAESLLGIGGLNKVRYALQQLWREELRRFREVYGVFPLTNRNMMVSSCSSVRGKYG
jgi:hypothetical protein